MENEYATIQVPIYRDKDGWHVCRLSAEKSCPFLGLRAFGQISVCMKGEQHDLHAYACGYIKPDCGLVAKRR